MVKEKLNARQIASKSGIDPRPEYYSGRPVSFTDLNDNCLENMYSLIKRDYGEDAADNFVSMVANLETLAASDFLTCLYFLEGKGWKYDGFQTDLVEGIAVPKDKEGNYDLELGMMGLVTAMSSKQNGYNVTEEIRRPFLHKHGIKSSRCIRRDFDRISMNIKFKNSKF